MNQEAYKAIIDGLASVATEIGLEKTGSDNDIKYGNSEKSIQVKYDENRQMFELIIYDVVDSEISEQGSTLSSWLFDNAHNVRDAKAIALDFEESIRDEFGVKAQARKREITLPSKGAPGSTPDPEALAQRFLAIYPAYKDIYKEHVEKYGEFLYEDFFKTYATPKLRDLLIENNKKQVEKFVQMLDDIYIAGNLEVSSTITLTIIAGAVGNDEKLWETFTQYTKDRAHLKGGALAMIKYAKQKNLLK